METTTSPGVTAGELFHVGFQQPQSVTNVKENRPISVIGVVFIRDRGGR